MTTAKSTPQDEGVVEARRLTAPQIFDAAAANAHEELRRSDRTASPKPPTSCLSRQFATDLANNALPQYSFIAPNVDDDAHNGSLAQADTWLQSNVIVPLTASPAFQSTLLIITFDEGNQADLDHGGDTSPPSWSTPKPKKDSGPPTPTSIRAHCA